MSASNNTVRSPRILVLRGGGIGDFILTLPVFAKLKERWPGAHIELVGYPRIAGLSQAGGLVDAVVSLDRADIAKFFSLNFCIDELHAVYVRSFDVIISYLYDPGETVKENMAACKVKQFIYGSPMVQSGHAVDVLLKPLETLALYPEGMEYPKLQLPDASLKAGREACGRCGKRVFVIHPGSGGAKKNWPLKNFLEVAHALRSRGITVVLSTGEADSEIEAELRDTGKELPIVSGLNLLQLAELLSACAGYAGNDSGITHLAAALGIPVTAVFGPTSPEMWAPRGPNVRIVTSADGSGNLCSVSVGQVLDAAAERLR